MVHRWAAAHLRGERDHDTAASQAEGRAAASLLDWYTQGLAALVDTVRATAEDAKAMVFLRDAPPPRRFWARRQAHETTIHSVDAIAARCRRWPTASDVAIDPVLAADGIDELLMGFITRGKGRLTSSASGANRSAFAGADLTDPWNLGWAGGVVVTPSPIEEVMGVPAWKPLPSWFLVADGDQAIPPDAQRQFAPRMGATTVEVPTNHVAMVSHPDEVLQLIRTAAEAVPAAT
jgi:hypothetical protein